MSLSIADWTTELKKRLLNGPPCFVPRAIPNSSPSTSVSTVARWSLYNFLNYSLIDWFLRDLQIASCCTESSAFLMSIAATLMSVSHSLLLWDMSLYVKRWSGCLELFLNPAWSAHWYRSSTARSGLYSIVERERSLKLWKTTDRPVVLWICHASCLVDHCDQCFSY